MTTWGLLMLILFVDQEREAELDSLGDPLALLDKHVDFAALAGRGGAGLARFAITNNDL